MERFTITHLENGQTKAKNGLGEIVDVRQVTDRFLNRQGCYMIYNRTNANGSTWIDRNGEHVAGIHSVLDLFVID